MPDKQTFSLPDSSETGENRRTLLDDSTFDSKTRPLKLNAKTDFSKIARLAAFSPSGRPDDRMVDENHFTFIADRCSIFTTAEK
mgnify:CR=1 FL=1